ncbi:hypothetical protein [Photobacterium salinisoli]|uniref:hypothetical protein n=1 Tax=Photobacterium salinisoli TaxID=1616783 RepID=UPI000EA12BF9|nr:hypothetical protein [Photobacterium salinisoli]
MKMGNFSFYAPILALFIIVALIGINVVWKNVLLKDVVIAYFALIAASVAFSVALFFSLKSDKSVNESKVTSYIIHKGDGISVHDLKVRAPRFNHRFDVYNREDLTQYYGIQDSSLVKNLDYEGRNVLFDKVCDVAKTILIGDLIHNFPDWDAQDNPLRQGGGKSFRIDPQHAGKDTYISSSQLLEVCGLNYPESKLVSLSLSNGIFLPPQTKVNNSKDGLIIENEFVKLEFHFDININYESNLKFYDNGYPFTIMDGSPHEYNAYIMYSSLITTYKSYKGHIKMDRYKKWAKDINEVFYATFSTYPRGHDLYTG